MNDQNLQFARLLREAGSGAVLEALAEYCEACAEQLAALGKNNRAEAFLEAGQAILFAGSKIAIAERESKSFGAAPCTLADAAEEQAGISST